MRYLIILFLFTFFLSADYLNTRDNNHCAYDVEPKQDSKGLCYTDSNDGTDECDRRLTYDDLIDGYNLEDGKCVLKHNLKVTGLSQQNWNLYMVFLANGLGFTMIFLISFIAILTVRK